MEHTVHIEQTLDPVSPLHREFTIYLAHWSNLHWPNLQNLQTFCIHKSCCMFWAVLYQLLPIWTTLLTIKLKLTLYLYTLYCFYWSLRMKC